MASDINYVYINKESINEHLKCAICKNPLIDPVSTNCQPEKHIFCGLCISDLIARYRSCPIFHQQLNNDNLEPIKDSYLINALDELRIRCKLCNESGLKRINFNAHLDNVCPKATITCPSKDIMCAWVGPRDQIDTHLNRCIFNILKPLFNQFQEKIDIQQKQIEKLQNELQSHVQKLHKPDCNGHMCSQCGRCCDWYRVDKKWKLRPDHTSTSRHEFGGGKFGSFGPLSRCGNLICECDRTTSDNNDSPWVLVFN